MSNNSAVSQWLLLVIKQRSSSANICNTVTRYYRLNKPAAYRHILHLVISNIQSQKTTICLTVKICYVNSLYQSTLLLQQKWNSRFRTRHSVLSLQWRHNERDSVSNHQPRECLVSRLIRRRSKKTSKLRVTGLCAAIHRRPVNSPHKGSVTRKMFPFDDVIISCHTLPSLLTIAFSGNNLHQNESSLG